MLALEYFSSCFCPFSRSPCWLQLASLSPPFSSLLFSFLPFVVGCQRRKKEKERENKKKKRVDENKTLDSLNADDLVVLLLLVPRSAPSSLRCLRPRSSSSTSSTNTITATTTVLLLNCPSSLPRTRCSCTRPPPPPQPPQPPLPPSRGSSTDR